MSSWHTDRLNAVAAIQHFHDTLCPPAPSVTAVAGASTSEGAHDNNARGNHVNAAHLHGSGVLIPSTM